MEKNQEKPLGPACIFLEAGLVKWGRRKKDTNARVAGRRKQTNRMHGEALYMDNIPMALNESDDSSDELIKLFKLTRN